MSQVGLADDRGVSPEPRRRHRCLLDERGRALAPVRDDRFCFQSAGAHCDWINGGTVRPIRIDTLPSRKHRSCIFSYILLQTTAFDPFPCGAPPSQCPITPQSPGDLRTRRTDQPHRHHHHPRMHARSQPPCPGRHRQADLQRPTIAPPRCSRSRRWNRRPRSRPAMPARSSSPGPARSACSRPPSRCDDAQSEMRRLAATALGLLRFTQTATRRLEQRQAARRESDGEIAAVVQHWCDRAAELRQELEGQKRLVAELLRRQGDAAGGMQVEAGAGGAREGKTEFLEGKTPCTVERGRRGGAGPCRLAGPGRCRSGGATAAGLRCDAAERRGGIAWLRPGGAACASGGARWQPCGPVAAGLAPCPASPGAGAGGRATAGCRVSTRRRLSGSAAWKVRPLAP